LLNFLDINLNVLQPYLQHFEEFIKKCEKSAKLYSILQNKEKRDNRGKIEGNDI